MKAILLSSASALLFASCEKQQASASAPASAPAPSHASTATGSSATKPYPLDVCIVSGEKLGEMGEPVVIVYQGQQIKFCCDQCQPKFEKDPAKYLSKLDHPKP